MSVHPPKQQPPESQPPASKKRGKSVHFRFVFLPLRQRIEPKTQSYGRKNEKYESDQTKIPWNLISSAKREKKKASFCGEFDGRQPFAKQTILKILINSKTAASAAKKNSLIL